MAWLQHFYFVYLLQPFWQFCIRRIPWFFAVAYLNVHNADHKAQGALLDNDYLARLVQEVNKRREG